MQQQRTLAISFTVPYLIPPSGQHRLEPCRYTGRDGGYHLGFKLSKQTRAFYDAMCIFARGESVAAETEWERKHSTYHVEVHVYLGPHQRGDFDNFWKCALDGLQYARVIHSDAAVDGEHSRCIVHRDDRKNPRTVFHVERIEHV